MRPYGLLILTVVTLVLTGLALTRAGWLQNTSAACDRPAHLKAHVQISLHDALTSEAAWRWRHCQPHHWRACLLQR
jgi:hypothetical protein